MRHIFLISLLALIFGSCIGDQRLDSPVQAGDEASVRLTIHAPRSSAGTRAWAADVEYNVEQVSILVFTGSGSNYTYQYMANGEAISTNPSTTTTTFTAKLNTTKDPLKLLIVANHMIDTALFSEGDSEEDVRSSMVEPFIGSADLTPMYGEISLTEGLSPAAHNFHIQMLRSFARASVVVDLDENTPPFEITSLYVVRSNEYIRVVPDLSAMTSLVTPNVNRASVPAEAGGRFGYMAGTVATGFQTYISESLSVTDPTAQVTDATCLVVGGLFNGSDNASYYRIDFNAQDQPFGQVLRNYDYQFTIKSVYSEGWPTVEDAATNVSSSIIADLVPWNTMVSQVYIGDGGDIFTMLEKNEIVLRSTAGDNVLVEFTSTDDFEYGFADGVLGESTLTGVWGVVSDPTLSINAGILNVEDHGTYKVYTMQFTSVFNNDTGATTEYDFYFYLPGWRSWLRVYQLSSNEEPIPVVNVLSVGTAVGSLGGPTTSMGTTQPLKDMLSNPAYFGPSSSYVNTIKGFNFSMSEEAVFENDTYNASLEMLLNGVDVLILPYTLDPTTNASTLIKQWIEGDNHRVLLMMRDSGATNENVAALLDPSLVWNTRSAINDLLSGIFAILLGGTGTYEGFVVADYTDDNAVILRDGPFGPVANLISTVQDGDDIPGDIFTGSDAVSQFIQELPTNFAPLVNFAASTTDGILGLGDTSYHKLPASPIFFDPDRRIIYCGEGQTMQTIYNNINSNEAIDGSPMNTMYLNLWAWIAETVVAR